MILPISFNFIFEIDSLIYQVWSCWNFANWFYFRLFDYILTGSVDLCSIRDPVVRHTYEIQILEFGQIPRQLFTKPHPLRLSGLIATAILTNDKEQLQLGEWSQEELSNLQLDSIFQGHKKRITDVTFSDDSTAISVSLDGFLKVYK